VKARISIWFFIGVSLLVNGILIVGAGIWDFFHPPANPVVLFRLHANIWWGALLLMFRVGLLRQIFCPDERRNSPASRKIE